MLPTFLDERIFVTNSCTLHFEWVEKSDEGLYSCYKRDGRYTGQWQSQSFVTFRLKIEAPSYKFPTRTDIWLGLLILTCWACFLTLLWTVLSIWSLDVNKTAIIQAGERMRRKDKLLAMASKRQGGKASEHQDAESLYKATF